MKSNVFKKNQRRRGTMITVLGPAEGKDWSVIRCKCDCGNVIELTYHQVYYCRFSCGCVRKERVNSIDYTGVSAYSARQRRTLTIIGRDSATCWTYICDCCAEIYTLPRGLERSVDASLRRLANQECPEYREFRLIGDAAKYIPYFKPENIKLGNKDWRKNGIWIKPNDDGSIFPFKTDFPLPKGFYDVKTKEEPVREDPDGFGDAFK